jgi:hypothetical protein
MSAGLRRSTADFHAFVQHVILFVASDRRVSDFLPQMHNGRRLERASCGLSSDPDLYLSTTNRRDRPTTETRQ